MNPKNWCLVLLAGLLFGAGLALSGMMDPSRVIGFLDFTGEWDPTLAFVMGGALLVFGIGSLVGRRKGKLPCFPSDPVSKSLIIGSALFGIGWGLGGFCPGPAIGSLGALRTEAFLFVPAMAIGMWLSQRLFHLDQ